MMRPPDLLALVGNLEGQPSVQAERDYIKALDDAMASGQTSTPFTYTILYALDHTSYKSNNIKRLLKSVGNFYLYAHGNIGTQGDNYPNGTMAYTAWNGVRFVRNFSDPSIQGYYTKGTDIDVTATLQGRSFNFVWLDCCHSAGGFKRPNNMAIGPPDASWAAAFNTDFSGSFPGAFWGWDGDAYQVYNQYTHIFHDRDAIWYIWRVLFWQYLAQGLDVGSASFQATLHTHGAPEQINPWDASPNGGPPYRAQLYGDSLTTFPY